MQKHATEIKICYNYILLKIYNSNYLQNYVTYKIMWLSLYMASLPEEHFHIMKFT